MTARSSLIYLAILFFPFMKNASLVIDLTGVIKMRKFILGFALCIVSLYGAAAVSDPRLLALHELFTTLGATVEPTYEAMNEHAQRHWLRKPGQERWQMDSSHHQDNAKTVKPILRRLGMLGRLDPTVYDPEYAIVLGATVFRMRTRMQHMLELMAGGRFAPKKIIVLVGERPLDPEQEAESVLLDTRFIRDGWTRPDSLPTNEAEAARFVWDQLPKPDCAASILVTFIAAPMLGKHGKRIRPSTIDTVNTWLQTSPKPGRIVAFSNNPYVPYQHETVRLGLLPSGWFRTGSTLETVGSAASEDIDMASMLDNVARYIFTIVQTQHASTG